MSYREVKRSKSVGSKASERIQEESSLQGSSLAEEAALDGPKQRLKKIFRRLDTITFLVVVAIVLAIVIGVSLRGVQVWNKRHVMYFGFLGKLFQQVLHCLLMPLLVLNTLSTFFRMKALMVGKLGAKMLLFFFCTALLSSIVGLLCSLIFQPGSGLSNVPHPDPTLYKPKVIIDLLLDIVRNALPENIIEATINRTETIIRKSENETNDTKPWDMKFKIEKVRGTNYLGLLVASTCLGIALCKLKDAGRPLLVFAYVLTDSLLRIMRYAYWLSPFGVFSSLLTGILGMDGKKNLNHLGMYVLTIVIGLSIHTFVALPMVYFAFARKLPFKFLYAMKKPLFIAFSTCSSIAAIPISLDQLEVRGVDSGVSRFVIILGSTFNLNGIVLTTVIDVIYVCQMRQVTLWFSDMILICLLSCIGCMTVLSTEYVDDPNSSAINMLILQTLGLNGGDYEIFAVLEWFVGRLIYGSRLVADFLAIELFARDVEMKTEEYHLANGISDKYGTEPPIKDTDSPEQNRQS